MIGVLMASIVVWGERLFLRRVRSHSWFGVISSPTYEIVVVGRRVNLEPEASRLSFVMLIECPNPFLHLPSDLSSDVPCT